MSWLDKLMNRDKPEKPAPTPKASQKAQVQQYITPICAWCEEEIMCLDTSIGDALESQGACLFSGSEGNLYQPIYDGYQCASCGLLVCDDCMVKEGADKTICSECGGTLRTIIQHRLPKADT